MTYLIAIHKDNDSDYGVSVPDLPGCISAGSTFEGALRMAKEAITLHLECMLEDGELPPDDSDYEAVRNDPDWADVDIWAVVQIEEVRNPAAAKRAA